MAVEFALPWQQIWEQSRRFAVEGELVAAVIMQESRGNQFAARFEPGWKYWMDPDVCAKRLGCTVETERTGQATSYGFMQVMGSVARELGFKDWFGKLYGPTINLAIGTAKLSQFIRRYPNVLDAVASYNAGSPVKIQSLYKNQSYVDGVIGFYREIKGIKASC